MNNLIKEKNVWNKNSILWPFTDNAIPKTLIFITPIVSTCTITHTTCIYHHIHESMEHKLHRIKQV